MHVLLLNAMPALSMRMDGEVHSGEWDNVAARAGRSPGTPIGRPIGYPCNASDLDHCDLEDADDLHQDDNSNWGDAMLQSNRDHGVKSLGGCCGTDARHIAYIRDGAILG